MFGSERPASCESPANGEEEVFKPRRTSAHKTTDTLLIIYKEVVNEHCRQEDGEYEEQNGVVRILRIMFSTPENISFFTVVVLSGMCRGFIDTFLFIWSVIFLQHTTKIGVFSHSCSPTAESDAARQALHLGDASKDRHTAELPNVYNVGRMTGTVGVGCFTG